MVRVEREVTSGAAPLGKWMQTIELPVLPGRKTKSWDVLGSDNSLLGAVVWYSPWRQYVFEPASYDIVLNKGCLRDLADFCERQQNARFYKQEEKRSE